MKESILAARSFAFALDSVQLYKHLCETQKEFTLSRQFLRSSTAIGALLRESIFAESAADFVHKLAIARKECNETIYWLELLFKTQYLTTEMYQPLHEEATQILKMLTSSIKNRKSTELVTSYERRVTNG